MAPLSLLGTVIRDKMMKTVTVQVHSFASAPPVFFDVGCLEMFYIVASSIFGPFFI
jgi:hypothetical protein